MSRAQYETTARAAARQHGLPEALVCAVCEVESAWNPQAVHYDRAFKIRYVDPLRLGEPEAARRATRWGLMQILGQSAIALGFHGEYPDLQQLSDPAIGLDFGCRKLKRCVDRTRRGGRDTTVEALLSFSGAGDLDYPCRVFTNIAHYRYIKP